MTRRRGGFTLVEVLLAFSLGAAVMLTTTSLFFRGTQVYARFQGLFEEETNAIWMHKLHRDLQNAADYSQVPWIATETSLIFPSFVPGSGDHAMRMINWVYDSKTGALRRAESVYPYTEIRKLEVVGKLHAFKFMLERDNEDSMPRAVTAVFETGTEKAPVLFEKTVRIPAGIPDSV